jgi:Tfp pilus assembly protein PilN
VKPIDINLASSPYRNDKPIWAALGVVAALALGFTGYNAWAFFSAGSRQAQLEQEIAGHRKRMHELKREADALQAALAKVDRETLTSQAEFVSSILDQRNFSWTRLFNSLEQVTPWDVKLISIRPQFEVMNKRTGEGRIRIEVSGIGRTFDSFLDLQDALQNAAMFSEVTPEEYERQADERIDFNLAFTYKPPEELPGESAEATAEAVAGERGAGAGGEIEEAGPELALGPADAAAADEEAPGAPPADGRAARGGSAAPAPSGATPTAPAGAGGRSAPRAGNAPGAGAASGDPAGGAALPQSLGVPLDSARPAAAGAEAGPAGAARAPSVGRAPRAGAAAGETTGAATAAPRPPGSNPPPVEVGEIDGKPVLKPRINPNRSPESGYRRRDNPPPSPDPPAGGDR